MKKRKTIAIAVDPRVKFGQAVIDGVAQYNLEQGMPWVFSTTSGLPYVPLHLMGEWKGDGAIGARWRGSGVFKPSERELAPQLQKKNIPFVNVATYYPELPVPSVIVDNRAIGELAARHFLEKGLQRFAIVTWEKETRFHERNLAFINVLANHGFPCETVAMPIQWWHEEPVGLDTEKVCKLLRRIEKPLGIFCIHDTATREVAEKCVELGLRVPEDVALLGEGNWHTCCEMVLPKLSSIDTGPHRVGYQAAELLDRLMNGEPPPTEPIRIPPLGVIQRQSTDFLATEDPLLRTAMTFIRENHMQPIQVSDVAEHVLVNRRTLEKLFRKTLGRSLHEEIRRSRIRTACELLSRTDMKITAIAIACGFKSWERFGAAFHREMHCTPSQYRQEYSAF